MDGAHATDIVDGTRVLVIDDDPAVCRATAAGLSRVGFAVVTALDGRGGIAQALATPPDVAVVDIVMSPSGVAVIRSLKQMLGDAVHVIALTGHDSDEIRHASLEAGCDDFVVKPLSMVDLQMRVEIAARKKRAFVEARLARETAERQHAYANEAVALLAHDLRNAIMECKVTLSFVAERSDLDDELTDLVRGSISSLRLMTTLVSNLLDVSRFEDARVKPVLSLGPVRDLLESVVTIHAASSANTCSWELDCESELVARLDRGLVERVLHNLTNNARRHAGAGGVIRMTARPWCDGLSESVEICVENSGPPVPEDVRPKLFSKYGRGPDGKRGLGLYFCRLACEAHGGRIDYETLDGRPVFLVRLPGTP